jgi:PilZ domain
VKRLKPGFNITMVFEFGDEDKGLKTMVYDVKGKNIVLSQTSPPMLQSHIGRRVKVSFVVKREGLQDIQLNFAAEIVDFKKNYEISSSQSVPVIMLEQKSDLEEINQRKYCRIKPPKNSNLTVLMENDRISIIDISLGGARLALDQEERLPEPDKEVKMAFLIDGRIFNTRARLVRVEEERDAPRSSNQKVFAIQFDSADSEFERFLFKKIMMMERQLLGERNN